MSGRIGRNLRQGHKAEGLGVELIRPFCAVAHVPQSEDIGFDAVATLLRDDDGLLYAEESFCVQFKARSVRTITYQSHEYEWLRALTLPLFIGSVDLKAREIYLYTTHSLVSSLNGNSFTEAVMYLDPVKTRLDDTTVHQTIGPPILYWTAVESENVDFQKKAYEVLKAWTTLEYANLKLMTIRSRQMVQWQTNEIPTLGWHESMGHPSEFDKDIEAAMPYLRKISTHFFLKNEVSFGEFGFFLFVQWLKEKGFSDAELLSKMAEIGLRNQYASFNLSMKLEIQNDANEV